MYGGIWGFQRLAGCPKWTPASIRSFTWTMATHCPPIPSREKARFRSAPNARARVPPPLKGKKAIVAAEGDRVKGFREKKHLSEPGVAAFARTRLLPARRQKTTPRRDCSRRGGVEQGRGRPAAGQGACACS